MRKNIWAALAALSLLCLSGTTHAAEPNAADCFHKEKEIQAALDANTSSPNADEGRMEHRAGRQDCLDSRYSRGLKHFAKAQALLGADSAERPGGSGQAVMTP